MLKWLLPIAVSIFLASIGLAERFYARFYPEVETQKRHLKTVGAWFLNIAAVAVQIWVFADAMRGPMPTKPSQLVSLIMRVAFSISFLCVFALILILDKLIKRIVNVFEHQIEIFRGQSDISKDVIGILKGHSRALLLISTTAGPDIQEPLKRILEEDGII